MYVLCSPCVLNPSLRADGITKPSDLRFFRKATERCKKFGIEMVPLPCPETLYLGPDRPPGTFLERLNTPEFLTLTEDLVKKVDAMIELRGSPLCIIGVNSSPTCGVTTTYYGSDGDEPPKRMGRGVFLARFPGITAVDVAAFAAYRVYLAAPLFSEAERRYNESVRKLLLDNFFEVYLPQEAGDDSAVRDEREQEQLFLTNKKALEESDILVAVIDGADADSGTAWEMGYAFARGIPVIAIRTDFRRVGEHEQVNLMLEYSARIVGDEDQLLAAITHPDLWKKDR
jgi:nucleoside 2-deoxyribosyltransferase/predicted secreted protein